MPVHRAFLSFAFRDEAYQYRELLFGLALYPLMFTKGMTPTLAPLRLQGIHVLNYIHDWFILPKSEELATQPQDLVLVHMKHLEHKLILKKSVLSPKQRTTFLGIVWESIIMQAHLSHLHM